MTSFLINFVSKDLVCIWSTFIVLSNIEDTELHILLHFLRICEQMSIVYLLTDIIRQLQSKEMILAKFNLGIQ